MRAHVLLDVVKAIEHGFGAKPVFIREGGSIPIVDDFARQLDADVLLAGVAVATALALATGHFGARFLENTIISLCDLR